MRRWSRRVVKPRTFQTANGITTVDQVARMTVGEFHEEVARYILDSTPAVVSEGFRRMILGYSVGEDEGHTHLSMPTSRAKAGLGHPDAGTYWEAHSNQHTLSAGFRPIEDGWVSCSWHDKLSLLLIIDVDDFKLSGPEKNINKGWESLRKDLVVELEPRVGNKDLVYMGCTRMFSF